MSYTAAEEEGTQIIECADVMDITTAAELRTQLIATLESKQPMVLDASRVERIDTAALQALSAFVQDANSQQQTVQWKDPSEVLSRSAELLGLAGLLNLSVKSM